LSNKLHVHIQFPTGETVICLT